MLVSLWALLWVPPLSATLCRCVTRAVMSMDPCSNAHQGQGHWSTLTRTLAKLSRPSTPLRHPSRVQCLCLWTSPSGTRWRHAQQPWPWPRPWGARRWRPRLRPPRNKFHTSTKQLRQSGFQQQRQSGEKKFPFRTVRTDVLSGNHHSRCADVNSCNVPTPVALTVAFFGRCRQVASAACATPAHQPAALARHSHTQHCHAYSTMLRSTHVLTRHPHALVCAHALHAQAVDSLLRRASMARTHSCSWVGGPARSTS
jgi:hypothetical protein